MGMLVAAEEGATDERPCLTMFESKEEVERTMLALKIFPDIDQVVEAEQEDPETDEEEYAPQVFPEHTAAETRYTRSLYYGALPATDRPSLPLTRLAVDQFTSSGLDALGQKLGRLDMARAADISRQACAGPNSLVLALLYLDKLRKRNPDYLTTVSSADLFLVSLMVASKFLHDDGEEDEVFNDEWASSGGIDTKELNKLELSFLSALDWRIYVDNQEFEKAVKNVETDIAFKEVTKRGWASYTDLDVLSTDVQNLWTVFISYTMKMTAVCVTAYAAGILSLLGTAAVLQKTPVGPEAVSSSIRTLSAALSSNQDEVPDYDFANESHAHVTPADIISASLLVTTLTGVAPIADTALEDLDIHISDETVEKTYDGIQDSEMNQTQANWLADYSKQEQRTSIDWDRRPPDEDSEQSPFLFDSLAEIKYLNERKGTGAADNLGLIAGHWSEVMRDQKPDSISSYLGKCPVLTWASGSLRNSWWGVEPGSWVSVGA